MQARLSAAGAQAASQKPMVEKLCHARCGQRSERNECLLEWFEVARDELSANVSEDDLAAEKAATATTEVKVVVGCMPGCSLILEHLPRERVVLPEPEPGACCGSDRLSKVGENVTQTLEVIPCQWKVIQTMREKFRRRDREKICQPPMPFCAPPPACRPWPTKSARAPWR